MLFCFSLETKMLASVKFPPIRSFDMLDWPIRAQHLLKLPSDWFGMQQTKLIWSSDEWFFPPHNKHVYNRCQHNHRLTYNSTYERERFSKQKILSIETRHRENQLDAITTQHFVLFIKQLLYIYVQFDKTWRQESFSIFILIAQLTNASFLSFHVQHVFELRAKINETSGDFY